MLTIIGLVNPYDGEALAPEPVNCSGWRLWQMTGLSRDDYLRISRRNLFQKGTDWDREAAAAAFRASVQPGDVVLVLGDEARRALWLPRQLIWPTVVAGVTYRQIPHPSGRCLFYNDPVNTRLVEVLLRCLTSSSQTSAGGRTATSARAPNSPRGSRTR